jgi:hypothetical protein
VEIKRIKMRHFSWALTDGGILMSGQERCPKNPSMLRAYCSHCQGTNQGTLENPRFSLKEDYLNGSPVVEVLKNGGPVHFYDSNFRFGVRKAQMLLACLEVLKEFYHSTEEERLSFPSRLIEDRRHSLTVQIYVEMHQDFEISTGAKVERPWLRLNALPPDKEHLGLGMVKCRAVYAVKDELRRWLRKHGVRDYSIDT